MKSIQITLSIMTKRLYRWLKPVINMMTVLIFANCIILNMSHASNSEDRSIIVSAGYNHTCAVLVSGLVKCWGLNSLGALGIGSTFPKSVLTPMRVRNIKNAVSVTTGSGFSCALLENGRVKCWGNNFFGQLGDGFQSDRSGLPVTVVGISNAVSISAGRTHACATLSSGRIKCWGTNGQGELGNADLSGLDRFVPITAFGINNAQNTSLTGSHSCALLRNQRAKCWGNNDYFQLGTDNVFFLSAEPLYVIGLNNVVDISPGGEHTCAVIGKGKVKCWGRGAEGQLGNGNTFPSQLSTPVVIPGIKSAVSISGGGAHNCALLNTGRISCWGDNSKYQAGNADTTIPLSPTIVNGITNATSVSAGNRHTCAVIDNKILKCWGSNRNGQIGDGTRRDARKPVMITLE